MTDYVLSHVFCLHGFPIHVVWDRGPQFICQFWKAFCFLLGATISLSPGYHPQSNGQMECLNQELETSLCCLISQNLAFWSKHLIWVEYAHNTLAFLLNWSLFRSVHLWPPASSVPHLGGGGFCTLCSGFICRFSCLKGDKPSSCKLPRSMRVHPTFHVAQVKPVKESSCSRRHINCHLVYTVRQLLVVWRPSHGCQYLVDWEGYDPEERSWVPASNIVDPDLMCRP